MAKSKMQLGHQFYALSIRERSLILAAGLVLIMFGGYLWFIDVQMIQIATLQQQINQGQSQAQTLEQQNRQLQQELSVDPDKILQKQITTLLGKQSDLDEQLANETVNLVPAKQMPKLLSSVLHNSHDIKLVSMVSIPPTAILSDPSAQNASIQIYQHGVKLVLEGRYFAIHQYLKQLKESPWRFYWRKFDYRVEQHPLGKVELDLYTLSTNQAFIGI